MGITSVLFVSLAAGLILVICGGIMMYMATLVRSAYEIKVQINTDIEDRLTKMSEALDQKTRSIKLDMIEDINKVRAVLAVENSNRLEEMSIQRNKRLDGLEPMVRAEHGEWVKAVVTDRLSLTQVDARVKAVFRDIKRTANRLGAPLSVDAVPGQDDTATPASTAPTDAPAAVAAEAAPPSPTIA